MVAALRRRRGTRAARSGICGESNPILKLMVLGMGLISVGVFIGLGVQLSSTISGSPTGEENTDIEDGSVPPPRGLTKFLRAGQETVGKAARRAAEVAHHAAAPVVGGGRAAAAAAFAMAKKTSLSAPKPQKGSGGYEVGGLNQDARKALFLSHIPEIRTKGAFPFYPDDGKLVDPHHPFSNFEAPGGMRFEEWKFGDSPYTYEMGESDDLARSRRYHVKKAMEFAWAGYEKYAFGYDEILPVSSGKKNGWGGFGTTLVDSLDTLWLMDMKDEFYRARDWVRDSLNNNRFHMVSFFETTIRSLGGLLAGTYPPMEEGKGF